MTSFCNMFYLTDELINCLEILYEILDKLEAIRIALENGVTPAHILNPPFDPFKTIRLI